MTENRIEKGYLQLYIGTGKGKTTASLGLAIRAKGRGKKVAIIFFDKGAESGERVSLQKLDIPFFVTGENRVLEQPNERNKIGKFRFGVNEEDQREGQRGLAIFQELLEQNYDLIILDEINSSIDLGVVDKDEFLSILSSWQHDCELVCTGRNPPQELLDQADLITEMTPVRHYFEKHVPSREGIEY